MSFKNCSVADYIYQCKQNTKQQINSMEMSPFWRSTSRSVTQEFATILLHLRIHHHVQNSPTLISILNQINTVHTTPFYFSEVHINIIFPHSPRMGNFNCVWQRVQVPYCAVFSDILLFHSPSVQIFSLAPIFQIFSFSILPLILETRFHTRAKLQA
jgi:hypothetical protein